jgi:hypothetical protein
MSARASEIHQKQSLSDFLSGQYQIEKRQVEEEPRARDVEAQAPVTPVAGATTHLVKDGFHKSASSALEARDDPFAPREGKTLTWQNVNMVLVSLLFVFLWRHRNTSNLPPTINAVSDHGVNSSQRRPEKKETRTADFLIRFGARSQPSRLQLSWGLGTFRTIEIVLSF